MTSTSGFQGGDVSKPTSRVLQPPGGATSNIFGGEDGSGRKPIKPANNSHSNIFGTEENAEPVPTSKPLDDNENEANNDEQKIDVQDEVKEPQKGSPWKEDNRTPFEAAVDNRRRMRESSNPITGCADQSSEGRSGKLRGGFNPITGENYSDDKKDDEPAQRRRQPPGGHSSGLW